MRRGDPSRNPPVERGRITESIRPDDAIQTQRLRAILAFEQARKIRDGLASQIGERAKRTEFRIRYRDRILGKILSYLIGRTEADMGNVQLLDPVSGKLLIRQQSGFAPPFLEFFNTVESGRAACGAALSARQQVIVADTTDTDHLFDGGSLEAILDANVRAVISTPLVGSTGEVVGVISTHYREPTVPTRDNLRVIGYFARYAASLIEWNDETRAPSELQQLAI
jgi:GAF domain-containing protein